MMERIERELTRLREGGQDASVMQGSRLVVMYRAVPTAGEGLQLPSESDVIVPVPDGYPAAMIDLAGLPVGSPLLARVRGGGNIQGIVEVDGKRWQLASYHPHNGGGGPPWDPGRLGFHTYFDYVVSWLARLN